MRRAQEEAVKYKNDTSSICDEFKRLPNGGMVDCWLNKGHEGPHNFDRSQKPKEPTEVERLRAAMVRLEEAEKLIAVLKKTPYTLSGPNGAETLAAWEAYNGKP